MTPLARAPCLLAAMLLAGGLLACTSANDDETQTPLTIGLTDNFHFSGWFEGSWVIHSLTIEENGEVLTVTRNENPGLLGDIWFHATGRDTGTIHARQTVLYDDLLGTGDITLQEVNAEVTDQYFIIRDRYKHADYYRWQLEGGTVMLTYDEGNLLNNSYKPARAITLVKIDPWTDVTVGQWAMTTMSLPGEDITGGECLQTGPYTYARMTMQTSIDRWLLFDQQILTEYWDYNTLPGMPAVGTDACDRAPDYWGSILQKGYVEEVDGKHLRLWLHQVPNYGPNTQAAIGNPQKVEFDIATVGDSIELTQTSCKPMPACTNEVPTTVQLTRAK